MAWYFRATPFVQAGSGVIIPLCLVMAWLLRAPVLLVMVTLLPYVPILVSLALQAVGLREFGILFGSKVRLRHFAFLTVGFWLYQLVLTWAALRAVVRYFRKQTDWEKTFHPAAHRKIPAPANAPGLAVEEAA